MGKETEAQKNVPQEIDVATYGISEFSVNEAITTKGIVPNEPLATADCRKLTQAAITNSPMLWTQIPIPMMYTCLETELEELKKGPPLSHILNYGIACLTTAISTLVSYLLATTIVEGAKYFMAALIIVGFLVGFILLLHWFRNRKDFEFAISKIEKRGIEARALLLGEQES